MKHARRAHKRLSHRLRGKPRGRVTGRSSSRKSFKRRPKTFIKKRSFGKVKGGYLNHRVAFKHGHHKHISSGFKKRVQEAAVPVSVQPFLSVTPCVIPTSACSYTTPVPLFASAEVTKMFVSLAGSTAFINSSKFLVREARASYQVKNSTNVSMQLRIYECEPRFDIPYTTFKTGLGTTATTVQGIINQGFADITPGGSYDDPTQTLFNNPGFCSKFKINSARVQKLVAGEEIKIGIMVATPHIMNAERWWNNTQGGVPPQSGGTAVGQIYMAAGLSKFLVLQAWGGIVTEALNVSQAGYFGGELTIINNLSYQLSEVVPSIETQYATSTGMDGQGNTQVINASFTTAETIIEQTGVLAVALDT